MESKKYVVLSKLSKTKFKRYTGVSKDVFEVMVKLVSQQEQKRKKKEGRTAHLSIEDQILMTLEYYREYRTFFHLGTDNGLDESNLQRTVVKIESILIKSGYFNLPGKKVLLSADQIETILTDATETPTARQKKVRNGRPINRSGKGKRKYSGKKKRFVNKTQVVVDAHTKEVICVDFALGACHDYKLYKQSKLRIHPHIKLKTDSGYLGLKRLHPNSELPQKNTKLKKLTKQQKKHNRQLARERIGNEHVIGKLKIFKLLENRYRNHARFGLRFTLIAGFYNANLNAA